MNFNEIKELISLINESDLSYLEVKNESDYIKIDKSMNRNYSDNNAKLLDKLSDKVDDINSSTKNESNILKEEITNFQEDEGDFEYIKSPIVGIFYEAASPESAPFVSKGQKIKKGEVVCIVEAMKLMNEITAEYDCEIVDILNENGQMVEYGSSLFKIRRV